MASAYPVVQKVTKFLRTSLVFVYANYALAFWTNMLMPRFVPKMSVDLLSRKFTMAFSNTPGPIKPFIYLTPEKTPVRTCQSAVYLNSAGQVGLNVATISFCNSFKITVTSDVLVFD